MEGGTMKHRTDLTVKANERAFEMEGGQLVVVKVTRKPAVETGTLHVKARARVIDADGNTLSETPAHVRGIMAAALAEGRLKLEDELADVTRQMARQAVEHHAALEAWRALPEDDEEEGPAVVEGELVEEAPQERQPLSEGIPLRELPPGDGPVKRGQVPPEDEAGT